MERASKAQLKQLGKATKEAAHTALRAAKRLMRAQREAGVSEDQAEDDYSRSEHFYDDFGEHLRENTGDLVEHFYQAVGHRVEARMDTLGDEAEREYDENQRSIDSMRDAAGPGNAVAPA